MKTNNEGFLDNRTKGKKTITRKEAICKAWFMALSAVTTMILLSVPKAAHASAPSAPADAPSGGGTWTKRT